MEGIGNWGFGIREGVGADAPTNFYGECAQTRVKSPYSRKELGIGD